jgi:hypothetical protein
MLGLKLLEAGCELVAEGLTLRDGSDNLGKLGYIAITVRSCIATILRMSCSRHDAAFVSRCSGCTYGKSKWFVASRVSIPLRRLHGLTLTASCFSGIPGRTLLLLLFNLRQLLRTLHAILCPHYCCILVIFVAVATSSPVRFHVMNPP